MTNTIEFTAIPSGDYESFCWDVTEEEFTRITGKAPERWDKSYFNDGMFRLYPGLHLPDCEPPHGNYDVKIEQDDTPERWSVTITAVPKV